MQLSREASEMALTGATEALLKIQTPLQQLLEDINFQRTKELRQMLKDDSGFVVLQGTTYWTDLFVRHFLFQSEPVQSIDSDDLLFFVRKKHVKSSSRHMPKYETKVDVFRKDSRKLPIGDPDVDWEETVYLNMIIHQFDYILTLAICTRTSPKELQVLRRHSQRVYASPSRRKMDSKGEGEEITYPHICFMVDNFDEVFSDILVRDGEMVCVELVANDKDGSVQGVIFLGSIRYDALKKVYDARQSSLSSKVAQRMSFGLFSSGVDVQTRCEFVRMKGPQGKGHAEMAVTKPKGSGIETPTSEPGFCATDMWEDWGKEDSDYYACHHQRRLSDPSANLNNFSRYGWCPKSTQEVTANATGMKARSENEGLDRLASEMSEIEAGDLRDDQESAFSTSAVKTTTLNRTHSANSAVLSPTSKSTDCSNCFGGNKCKRWASASPTSSAQMSEIYCPTCEESCKTVPTGQLVSNKKLNPKTKTTIFGAETEFVMGKSESFSKNTKNILGKNKKITKRAVSPQKEKHKKKIDPKAASKTTTKLSRNKKSNKDGHDYEIADDAKSLTGGNFHSGDCKTKIAILTAKDSKEMINVRGKEELPAVTEPILIHPSPKPSLLEVDYQQNSLPLENCASNGSENYDKKKGPPEQISVSGIIENDFEDIRASDCLADDSNVSHPAAITHDANSVEYEFTFQRHYSLPSVKKSSIQNVFLNKKLNLVPKRRTPDGTTIYYWCGLPKIVTKELDDGAHNPLWASSGFMQAFHFWKENRRQHSTPLNAFLTYVTLPWWSIAKDLLDHRETPILTF